MENKRRNDPLHIIMSRKLKIKNFLFQLLDKLPENIAYPVYHFIQEKVGKTTLEQKVLAGENTFTDFQRFINKAGITVEGKSVLEIGSGWLPIMPYFFKYFGKANEIFTYDLRKHYSLHNISKLNQNFSEKYSVRISVTENKFSLPQCIHYFPNTDLKKSGIPPVDIVFTRFVLEHITPDDLKAIHIQLKKKLKSGAHIVHFISPSDHRAYVDKTLSLQDFLKYSEEEWKSRQTKFDYHNRWRLPQYLDLFKSLDYEIIYSEFETPPKGSEAYKKFKTLNLHSDYKNYTEEQLMAGSINLVLKVN